MRCDVATLHKYAALAGVLLRVGCQAVNTTGSSAVGVDRKQYMFSMLSTNEINQSYAQAYQETLQQAQAKGKLDTRSNNAKRLQVIGQRLIAQAGYFRADAAQWDWQVSLIESPELNANCGPGGKIIFYSGIITKLNLTDDEIAAIMGHEIAHALREHSREAMSKAYGIEIAKLGLGAVLGVNQETMQIADAAVQYGMTLPNSRSAETEADLLGIELAARAGYNPNAAVSLWQKMEQVSQGAPAEFASTHPSSSTRIQNLQANIPKVMPLYEQARKR
ncbi:MAG: M48 family metallopeptidase [Gammaproteobacteria bacterium]|nr:M48 family metallopeptidase [Gammaproteobacteria bacterium]